MAVYFNDLDQAVYFTLAYSDYFNFPLTIEEIGQRLPKVWDWSFLIGQEAATNNLPIINNQAQLKQSLLKLENQKKIEKLYKNKTLFYFLQDRQQVVNSRIKREKDSLLREKAIKDASAWLKRFPTIEAVALTGSSALNNATINEDLDFCLIVKNNTLWVSRFFVILLAKLLNKQPQIDARARVTNKQAWCFNLWLDEKSLNLLKRSSSIYQAYELKQMRWLVDKNKLQKQLFSSNHQLLSLINSTTEQKSSYDTKQSPIAYLFYPINLFFYYIQSCYRFILFGQENFCLSLLQAHFNELNRQQHIFQTIKRKMIHNGISDF